MNLGRVFVVSGPSGAGKDTVVDAVIAKHPDKLVKNVSATTRPPRPGDFEGEDYFFLSTDEFQKRLAAGEFLDHFQIHDHWYGMLRSEIETETTSGKDVIMVIDVRGAQAIKQKLPNAVLIFINAPSMAELERRIRKRHGDNEETINLRLADAKEEIEIGKAEFDHVVVNDVLKKAIADVEKIILGS